MKFLIPIVGAGLVLWLAREVMPDETLAGAVPFAEQHPDLVHLLGAVITFVVLAVVVKKGSQSTL